MFQLPIRTLDSEHSTGSSELGQLPDWNLNDLYTATDAKELIRDLNWLEKNVTNLLRVMKASYTLFLIRRCLLVLFAMKKSVQYQVG